MTRLTLPALVGTLVAAPALLAQQGADSTRLPRVVITADRVPVPVERVTSTVTVLEASALRASGITHVLDALRQVPGLSLVRGGSFGAQTSLFTRGGESDYTKVLIDGVPMNDPGGSIDLAALTLDDVERIEVVRGPASVVHGSDAVSGVVQIVTRRALGREAHLAAGGGSYGSSTIDGGGSITAGRFGLSGSMARHQTDGILAFNNRYENTVASARLSHLGSLPASLTLRHVDNAYAYPTDGAGQVVDRNARRANRRTSAALEAERSLGSRVVTRLSGGWLDVTGRTDDRMDAPSDTLGLHTYLSRAPCAAGTRRPRCSGRPSSRTPSWSAVSGPESASVRATRPTTPWNGRASPPIVIRGRCSHRSWVTPGAPRIP
jgi:outer membrane cobalamin receptor